MSDGVDVVSFGDYQETVTERLTGRGFGELSDSPRSYEGTAFHHRDASLFPPGFVDEFVVLGRFRSPAIRTVREFSSRAYAFATNHDEALSRWVGGIPAAIAVAACEDPGEDVKRWIADYHAGHWRGFEFPVMVDMTEETVHYYSDTPLLGSGTYETFRALTAAALDPSTADPAFQDL